MLGHGLGFFQSIVSAVQGRVNGSAAPGPDRGDFVLDLLLVIHILQNGNPFGGKIEAYHP